MNMKRVIGMVVMATFAVAGISIGGDPKKELTLFQGNWKVVSIKESDKEKNPPDDFVKGLAVNVTGNVMKITTNKGKEVVVTFNLKLDPAKKPKAIDMTISDGPDKGKVEPGIYKFEGDKLTLCTEDQGKERPTTFATKEGTTISLIVLQKIK